MATVPADISASRNTRRIHGPIANVVPHAASRGSDGVFGPILGDSRLAEDRRGRRRCPARARSHEIQPRALRMCGAGTGSAPRHRGAESDRTRSPLTAPPFRGLRPIGAVPQRRVAHPLRFHQPSRGRRITRDRISHTRLCASVHALEESDMEVHHPSQEVRARRRRTGPARVRAARRADRARRGRRHRRRRHEREDDLHQHRHGARAARRSASRRIQNRERSRGSAPRFSKGTCHGAADDGDRTAGLERRAART